MELTNKHFIDWEAHVFGFGYGTGEQYTLPALKKFFDLCQHGSGETMYHHEELEKALTPEVAWLLINILAHKDIIEYGTSPRNAWLTEKGKLLKDFVKDKTADELYSMCLHTPEEYVHCLVGYCNCDGVPCNNPLFGLGMGANAPFDL